MIKIIVYDVPRNLLVCVAVLALAQSIGAPGWLPTLLTLLAVSITMPALDAFHPRVSRRGHRLRVGASSRQVAEHKDDLLN